MKFINYYFEDNDLRKQASQFKNAEDFLNHNYTGFIKQSTYDNMDFDKNIKETPILLKTIKSKTGEDIEFRQTGEKLKYAKIDDDRNIVRDAKGLALYMSDDEIKKRKIPLTDTTIHVFNSKHEEIGYASDEFGADGVWIKPEYQKQGIGTELLIVFKSQFKDDKNRKIGQMTPAGINMTKSYWRKLTGVAKPDVKKIIEKFINFLKNYDDSDDSQDVVNKINEHTPEYMRAYIRFSVMLSKDEKAELSNYFYPADYNPEISIQNFYNKYK